MNNENLIEKALASRLSETERQTFDALLQADEAFAAEFSFQQKVKEAVRMEERTQLKNKLIAHEKQPGSKLKYWAAAAMLAVALSAAFWLLNQPKPDLFAENYTKFPNIVAPPTRSESTATTTELAFKAYDTGNYEKAYQLLGELANEDSAAFYQGICLIEMEKYNEAIAHLKSISFSDEYENHRMWYLSLLYLNAAQPEKAKVLLEQLAEGQSVWREKAVRLLTKI